MSEPTLPCNLEAERAVLGAVLVSNDLFDVASETITAKDFYRHAHQQIFSAMTVMAGRNDEIDGVTLKDTLARAGVLDEVGGPSFIASLVDGVARATNVAYYARIIKDMALRRRIIDSADTMRRAAYAAGDDTAEVISLAERTMVDLCTDAVPGDLVFADAMSAEVYPVIERITQDRRPITGLPTGIESFDRRTRGLQNGEMTVLAGRTSMGKSSIAMQMAMYVAALDVPPVGFFSLEMSRESLELRVVAALADVDHHEMLCGQLSPSHQRRVAAAVARLSELHLAVDDTPGIALMEMRSKARRMKATKGLSMLVVDHVGLVGDDRRAENRTQAVSAIVRSLRNIARELRVPLIAVSQLSRKVDERSDQRPQLSDLRETGELEQLADVAAFVYRKPAPGGYSDVTELIVAKNRNGPLGSTSLDFIANQMRFVERREGVYAA